MLKCPFCREAIADDAIKCKHCGEIPVSHRWRQFVAQYRVASKEGREYLVREFVPEQMKELDRALIVLGQVPHITPARATRKTSPIAVGCLALIILGAIGAIIGIFTENGGTSASSPPQREPAARREPVPSFEPVVPIGPELELIDWNWSHEYGYAIAEGQVKNLTSRPLENVAVLVTFKDASGGFITSDDSLIEYNPLLPGQTSPFKVMCEWNPAMDRASVEFKYLLGGTIRHETR